MNTKRRPPIGSIAVQKGFVTNEQVEYALSLQRQKKATENKNIRLGDLLSELGFIDSKQFSELDSAGSLFNTLSEDAIRLAVQMRSDIKDKKNIIFITGVAGMDGVSVTAYQIALAFALMDLGRVLLLDTNFRFSFTKNLIKDLEENGVQQNKGGLSDFLLDKISIEQALVSTSIPKLDLMGTGDLAVDFYSLLLSNSFGQMLENLRKSYELILIDSPPILKYSEATAIAQRADQAILVVGKNKHSQTTIREAKNIFQALKVPFLGAILFYGLEKK